MISNRTIETIIRIIIGVVIMAIMIFVGNSNSQNQKAVLAGYIYADLLTWIISTILELPKYLGLAGIEGVLVFIGTGIFISIYGLDRPQGNDAEAIIFLVFMTVFSLKIGWYYLKRICDEFNVG